MSTTPDTTPDSSPVAPMSWSREVALAPVTTPIDLAEQPTAMFTAAEPDELLSLRTRRVLYLAGLAALVVGPVIAVQFPDYGAAIVSGGNMLGAVGLGTALANPTR